MADAMYLAETWTGPAVTGSLTTMVSRSPVVLGSFPTREAALACLASWLDSPEGELVPLSLVPVTGDTYGPREGVFDRVFALVFDD